MKVLIASIGSRGEVQPLVALALELKARGHGAVLCVAPNFRGLIESFGFACVPVGPDVQKYVAQRSATERRMPSRAQWRKMSRPYLAEQFAAVGGAARGCDVIVACGGLLAAGRSIAEARGIPYVYAAYCAGTLPSADHPPPMTRAQWLPALANRVLWKRSESSWNDRFRDAVNEQRAALRLPAIASVPRHVFTDRPWLAADPFLGSAGRNARLRVVQTGAWLLTNPAPLPETVERFLAAGDPPLYFGFGSMGAAAETGSVLIGAARAVGRRALVSRGWGNIESGDRGDDWLSIDEVDHAQLFPRVAAVVHHGGAGTTTTAALAGKPQVVVPHLYDQHYWAERVQRLGIGIRGPLSKRLAGQSLATVLHAALRPGIVAAAAAAAKRVERHGANTAAQRLVAQYGS